MNSGGGKNTPWYSNHLVVVAVESGGLVVVALIIQVVSGTGDDGTRAGAVVRLVEHATDRSENICRRDRVLVSTDTVASADITGPDDAATTKVAVGARLHQVDS
jgi:hypothetical protein